MPSFERSKTSKKTKRKEWQSWDQKDQHFDQNFDLEDKIIEIKIDIEKFVIEKTEFDNLILPVWEQYSELEESLVESEYIDDD